MKKTVEVKPMSMLGSFGGKSTLAKHGPEHFSKIAKKRWKNKSKKTKK